MRLPKWLRGQRALWAGISALLLPAAFLVIEEEHVRRSSVSEATRSLETTASEFPPEAGDALYSAMTRYAKAWVERAQRAKRLQTPSAHRRFLATLPDLPKNPNGRTLRLDDLLERAEVETSSRAESVDAAPLLEWEFGDALEPPLVLVGKGATMANRGGVLVVDAEGNSSRFALMSRPSMAIRASRIGTLVMRIRVQNGKTMEVGWSTKKLDEPDWNSRLAVDLIDDGKWHTYRVDVHHAFKRGLESGEPIRSLFLRPTDHAPDRVEIDFIRLTSRLQEYGRSPVGVAYEEISHELRHVLYTHAGYRLTYSLRIGPAAKLEMGVASLLEGTRCSLAVRLAHGKSRQVLWRGHANNRGWKDLSFDLSSWAGRTIDLTLESDPGKSLCLWSNPTVRTPPERRFNIIMVLEDTLRADHLSAWGYPRETSPARDRLAADGALFQSAYSQATKTRPSVPSLMTSLLPSATGVWNWSHRLAEQYLTLAEILRAMGFATASFVQNGNAGPYAGLHQGFEQLQDATVLGMNTTEVLGERLFRWIDTHSAENFFLYLHVVDPHGPYAPPAEAQMWEPTGQNLTPVPWHRLHDPKNVEKPTVEGRRARYDGEIRANDSAISYVVRELEARGLLENTLLVLFSDHGEHLGEHGLWEHHPPGYAQVVHVPLVMHYPEKIAPQRHDEPVMLVDLMPTILELAGADTSDLGLHGESLVGWLRGGGSPDRMALSEEPMTMTPGKPCGCGSLFLGPYHLLASLREGQKLRVFNRHEDAAENEDLVHIGNRREIGRSMREFLTNVQRINAAIPSRLSPPRAERAEQINPDVQERLKALGYVGE